MYNFLREMARSTYPQFFWVIASRLLAGTMGVSLLVGIECLAQGCGKETEVDRVAKKRDDGKERDDSLAEATSKAKWAAERAERQARLQHGYRHPLTFHSDLEQGASFRWETKVVREQPDHVYMGHWESIFTLKDKASGLWEVKNTAFPNDEDGKGWQNIFRRLEPPTETMKCGDVGPFVFVIGVKKGAPLPIPDYEIDIGSRWEKDGGKFNYRRFEFKFGRCLVNITMAGEAPKGSIRRRCVARP